MLEPQALTGKHAMPQFYNTWTKKIAEAQGREKNYRRLGKKVVDLYEAREEEASPYSIVYSNTEVLAPSVYNARPVPMVLRRYRDADPIGKAVAETSTRLLKYLVDVESANYDSFDELMQAAVLDGLLTNRGLTRTLCRKTFRKDSVPGTSPTVAMCGRLVRKR